MGIFNIDGPVMSFLGKVADLMLLNLLTVVCCIPVVTAGASLTAMHYVALKLRRNEEGYITRDFFRSFKQNFRQATVIWLILLVFIGIVAIDFYILFYGNVQLPSVFQGLLLAAAVPLIFTAVFVFPVLAKFDNPIIVTIKNAFMISILQFPKTILMIILNIIPVVAVSLSYQVVPIVVLFGLALPAYGSAFLYHKFFLKMEEQITGGTQAEEQSAEDGWETAAQEDWAGCPDDFGNNVQNDEASREMQEH